MRGVGEEFRAVTAISMPAVWEARHMSQDNSSYRGGIVVAGTPLGNIDDASPRLRHALATADVVAAEDTRRARNLANALGIDIAGRLVSNFDHNESSRVDALISEAQRGRTVLIISDAGMPVISDPGFPVVERAHDEGIHVGCIPGPSAVTTALAMSGLHVGTFCFDGFVPRKTGARREWLSSLVTERRACVFFESPRRIEETLNAAVDILGGHRRAAVCRELTKLYEEVRRGTLEDLAAWAAEGIRGEITGVLEGAREANTHPPVEELIDDVEARVQADGLRLKDACKVVADQWGMRKKDLYEAVVDARKASE